MSEFSAILSKGISAIGLEPLAAGSMDLLGQYGAELDKWAKKINLVAKAPLAQIIEAHFLDSLTLLPVLTAQSVQSGNALLDVGSGAGFPGLVMKIACPELLVSLVEPRQKRTVFLRHIIRTLGLKGVEVIGTRLDDGEKFADTHGLFSLITCRALTDIGKFLSMVDAVSPVGGRVICMKGPQVDDELAVWQRGFNTSFVLEDRYEFELPLSQAARVLVVFRKK